MSFDYVSESNFIVRKSGRESNSYYIDYLGVYKIVDISKLVHLEASLIKEKYLKHDAAYFDELDVYYFNNIEKAKSAIADILKNLKSNQRGRIIQLTEAEIEYIRQALINEGVNNIRVSSKVKDNIFKKLNS
ncbi:MAG: uncharacterized protein K0R50_479 [Eubacterium sp.]|jgi:hypothetical protein|nr:uncharacterized protein [Eubacterium sp.]